MLIKKIIDSVSGEIEVEIKGASVPQFVDSMMQEGIDPHDITIDGFKVRFRLLPKEYKRLLPIARKTHCKIQIIKKRGIPFLLLRNRKIPAYMAYILSFAATLIVLGYFIIDISVSGNSKVPDNEIINAASELGINFLSPRNKVDVPDAENMIMQEISELSWISVNLSYGSAQIEVNEKKDAPKKEFDNNQLYGFSCCDAVVTSVELKSGQALVSPGDVVSAGQLIAESSPAVSAHSWASGINGEILGITAMEFSKEYDSAIISRSGTGRIKEIIIPAFIKYDIPAIAAKINYDYYDAAVITKPLKVFNVKTPLYLNKIVISEVSQCNMSVSLREARAMFEMSLKERETDFGEHILSKETESVTIDNKYVFTAKYIVQKNLLSLG